VTAHFPTDIYTEPDADPDTLRNLGPLAPLAGIWEGRRGVDVHPNAEGSEQDGYLERYELQPIDPQTNGPQLLYGLRYHTHILRPMKPETFHDQVGYLALGAGDRNDHPVAHHSALADRHGDWQGGP